MAMDSILRGQGSIQMLLTAEQEAQQIVSAAKNLKMVRLRQAKEEAETEIARYRSHLEDEYQKKISQNSGSSDSTLKKLETETEKKILELKENFTKASPDVIALLTKCVANA